MRLKEKVSAVSHNLVQQFDNCFNAAGHSLVFVPDEPVASRHRQVREETHQTGFLGGHEVVANPDTRAGTDRLELTDCGGHLDVRSPVADKFRRVIEFRRVDQVIDVSNQRVVSD